MEFIGELVFEFLTGLADFDERKYPPFGLRYWLGWLGVLTNLLMAALLAFVTVFFLIAFLKGKGLFSLLVALCFLPFLLFGIWRSLNTFIKMCKITLFYKRIS